MKVLYFAWLRQKVGRGEETVAPPASIATVAALVEWLKRQSAGHAAAFANAAAVRVAVNQEFADWSAPVAAGDEIAFFPPVTGG
jgi:molybdopterin converting factor subunit 1